jgi:hypothetical protein
MMKNNMTEPIVIKGVIDRFEGEQALIKTLDHREISLPREKLTDDFQEGQAVYLTVSLSQDETAGREALAKTMLNEILNIPNNDTD